MQMVECEVLRRRLDRFSRDSRFVKVLKLSNFFTGHGYTWVGNCVDSTGNSSNFVGL